LSKMEPQVFGTEEVADLTAARSFHNVDEILQTAERLFTDWPDDRQERDQYRKWFHQSLELTPSSLPVCSQCSQHSLTWIEREIVLGLLLIQLGLLPDSKRNCGGVITLLGLSRTDKLAALRALHPDGRLAKSGLIFYEDTGEELRKLEPVVDPDLVETILSTGTAQTDSATIPTEEEFHDSWLSGLLRVYSQRMDLINNMPVGLFNGRLERINRDLGRRLRLLDRTLECHPSWRFSKLLAQLGLPGSRQEGQILLILLGKETGQRARPDDELFRGDSLAKAVSRREADLNHSLACLRSTSMLLEHDLIQPASGEGELLTDNYDQIARTEFELSNKALDILELRRNNKIGVSQHSQIRAPKIRLDQLVLSPAVRTAVDMAIAHARHVTQLVDGWGLGQTIQYGRAVTLLFHGPSGVGKTALAEALAHELGRPLLPVDYSRVQNCLVGGTEKSIVRAFGEAARHKAVLFWDEADTMLTSRENADRNWEIREVNVLLQELERFEGVCILSTNRERSLDPALERRITLKIQFDRPDRVMRRQIWQKLLPERMPLSPDVSLDRLSAANLTGGEIKNVVLNAARLALLRGPDGPVAMIDFERAIHMEDDGRLSQEKRSRIGFVRTHSS
jgi:hypothetical protein